MDFTEEQIQYINERFMELPIDADGVPIHVGDVMTAAGEDCWTVHAIGDDGHFITENEAGLLVFHDTRREWFHCKPDPLKELLNDHINDVLLVMTSGIGIALETALNDSFGEECADEIRELMKEGGDD